MEVRGSYHRFGVEKGGLVGRVQSRSGECREMRPKENNILEGEWENVIGKVDVNVLSPTAMLCYNTWYRSQYDFDLKASNVTDFKWFFSTFCLWSLSITYHW